MATKNLQEAFCLAYHSLPDVKGRGTRAAVVAGYSEKSAQVTASQLLAKPHIKARLDELAGRVPAGTPVAPPAHPSATGNWPFSPPGANHEPPPGDPNGAAAAADPFEGKRIEDPKVWLREAMNNPKLEPKHRLDAAKKLIDFEHAKIGETGKKAVKEDEAKSETGAGPFQTAPPPPRLKVVVP